MHTVSITVWQTGIKLGQIAFDMELTSKLRVEYGYQGFNNGGTQNIGWNRVTQQLVDDHMYLSGRPAVNLSNNGYNVGYGDIPPNTLTSFAFQQNMSGPLLGNPELARLYALDPATVKLVKLPLDQIMIDDGDFNSSRTSTAFADVVYTATPGFTIKNQLFFDHMVHQKYSSYGFGAGYRPWTIEDKLTATAEWKPAPFLVTHTIFGGGFRFVKVSAGEERNWYQVVDRRDLSVGATPNDRFAGPFNSNGDIFFQYYQKGDYGNTGLFFLTDLSLWTRLTATVGARFDRYTPTFTGRFNGEPNSTSSAANNAGTYNASVSYRLPFYLQPYFTVRNVEVPRSGTGQRDRPEPDRQRHLYPDLQPHRRRRQDGRIAGARLWSGIVLPPEAKLVQHAIARDRLLPDQWCGDGSAHVLQETVHLDCRGHVAGPEAAQRAVPARHPAIAAGTEA